MTEKVELYKDWKEKQSHKALDFFVDPETKKIPERDQIAYLHTMSIGGSMDSALLGLNKWTTVADVYNSFFNFKHSEDKFVFDRGHALEQFVAEQFQKLTHIEVKDGITVDGSKFNCPWAFAQVDRVVEDGTPLEIKVATYNTEDEDGKEWGTGCKFNDNGDLLVTDSQIPKAYYCQCQKQMWLTDKEEMYLASWLTSENHIRVYIIQRNDDFIELLKETEEDFLFNHVIPEVPYPADIEPLSREYEEKTVFADNQVLDVVRQLAEVNLALNGLTKEKNDLVKILKTKIGDFDVCIDEAGEKLFSVSRYKVKRFDQEALLNDHPEFSSYFKDSIQERLNLCKKKTKTI